MWLMQCSGLNPYLGFWNHMRNSRQIPNEECSVIKEGGVLVEFFKMSVSHETKKKLC